MNFTLYYHIVLHWFKVWVEVGPYIYTPEPSTQGSVSEGLIKFIIEGNPCEMFQSILLEIS